VEGVRIKKNVMKSVAILLLMNTASFGNVCVANRKFKINQVCGVVRDKDGVVVPGASVLLKRVDDQTNLKRVSTDQEGHFQFSDIPSGEYELRVKYSAFADAWQPITVASPSKSGKCRKPMSANMEFIGGCSSIEKFKKPHAQTH
jgi:hypothetical protein